MVQPIPSIRRLTRTDAMATDVARFMPDGSHGGLCAGALFRSRRERGRCRPCRLGGAPSNWQRGNTVDTLRAKFGCKPTDMLVGIGPSIGPCHYEVGPEVISEVEETFGSTDGYINDETPDGQGIF